jgi:hypothetical protein
MKGIIGYYNELEYHIALMDDGILKEDLYQAGNSPDDSNQYMPYDEGVGLDKMKEYCIKTGKDIAKEKGLPFLGVDYEEWEV